MFTPYKRGPQAEEAGISVRAHIAQKDLYNAQARSALKSFSGRYDLSTAEGLSFANEIETGQGNSPFAKALKTLTDDAWERAVEERPDAAPRYIKNYLGHMFKNPELATDMLVKIGQQKAALGGKGSFLYSRAAPTFMDMVDHLEGDKVVWKDGLEPVSNDLADMQVRKLNEINKFVMASRMLKELRTRGLGRFAAVGEEPPRGYMVVDDRVAAQTEGGKVRARFLAPEPVARLINNHLSPGFRGNPIFDAVRTIGNTINMAQLSYSGFHAIMVSLESINAEVANALLQGFRGNIGEALGTLVKAPLAPVKYATEGSKLLKEGYAPGTQGEAMANWLDKMVKGGGGIEMPELYRTGGPEAFLRAFREGRVGGMAKHSISAAAEQGSALVLKHYVPRIKLGAFMSIATEELKRLPEGASPDMEQAALAKAWDSVDNRFGQLRYDNLFWNNVLKDLSFATVRSVGWNLGTIREIGGGMGDILRGKASQRAAFVVALPVTVGLVGAIYHYIMTGEQPKDIKDMYFPRTGRFTEDGVPERVMLPSYMRDIVDYSSHPWNTLKNKMHPLIRGTYDMLENKDFYGQEIRNPNDPLVKQVMEEVGYWGKSMLPISARNAYKAQGAKGALIQVLGASPAPREIAKGDLPTSARDVRFKGVPTEQVNAREDLDKGKREISQLTSKMRFLSSNKGVPEDERKRLLAQMEARRAQMVTELQKRSRRLVDLVNTYKP